MISREDVKFNFSASNALDTKRSQPLTIRDEGRVYDVAHTWVK